MTSITQLVDHVAIPDEAWSRLLRASDDPSHPMRLVVLASVDEHNRPAARSLVLRGADRASRHLWFHTDVRSHKVSEFLRAPWACAIAYDPRDGVQLRIDGGVSVHTDDSLVDEQWAQMEIAVRYAYASDEAPGQPIASADPRSVRQRRLNPTPDDAGRRHFAVIELTVERIDWFQATTIGERRAVMLAEQQWRPQPLAP